MVQSKKITKKNNKSKKMVPIEFSGQKTNPRFLHQRRSNTTSNPLNLRAQQRILGSKQHTAKTEAASTPQNRGFGFSRLGWEDVSHEKNPALLSIKSWLVNRDPYNGVFIIPCTTQPTSFFFVAHVFFVNMLAQKKNV